MAILWPPGTIPPRGGHSENGQMGADQCHVAGTAVNSPGSRTDSLGLRPMRGRSKGKAESQLSHYRLEYCPWDLCPPSDSWGFSGRWGAPGWPEHLHRWLPLLSIRTDLSLPCFLLFLTTYYCFLSALFWFVLGWGGEHLMMLPILASESVSFPALASSALMGGGV